MSRAKAATSATAAQAAKEKPKVIKLDDAEQISLAVLNEKLLPLLAIQERILAKIAAANGLDLADLKTRYQFNGTELFIPEN